MAEKKFPFIKRGDWICEAFWPSRFMVGVRTYTDWQVLNNPLCPDFVETRVKGFFFFNSALKRFEALIEELKR